MKPKKLLSFLLATAMTISLLPTFTLTASAEKYTRNQYETTGLYYTKYDDHCEITDCDTDATSVIIPNEIENLLVTSIGKKAFYGCSKLSGVEIPDSVTNIGNNAFYGCSELSDVEIPDSVTNIGSYAFSECSNLNDITIGNSVTSIGSYAFLNCSSLYDVIIPDSVVSIGGCAFSGCSNLNGITIGNSVTSIGKSAFLNCSSLYDVIIPDRVASIGSYAFSGCSNLNDITIGNSVVSIGSYAFNNCSNLDGVEIPDSVVSISSFAFLGCSNLNDITIGNSVTSIGIDAFFNTGYYNEESNWTKNNGVLYIGNYLIKADKSDEADESDENISGNIEIENGTKLIADRAFCSCSGLTSITIPDSVTSIGESAFEGTEYYGNASNWTDSGVLYIGNYLIKADEEKISGDIEIENGTKLIADGAFSWCKSLTSIKIPDTVTNIGSRAFYSCSKLTSLYIPSAVTSIGSEAFYGCSGLNCINYDGTKKEWKAITIDSTNELTNVEINYLREPPATTVNGKIFTVTGKNIDGYTVILALYKEDSDGNSQLVECQTAEYSGSEKKFTTTATDYTSAKVMVWKDLETLEPVCEAYEMKFQ